MLSRLLTLILVVTALSLRAADDVVAGVVAHARAHPEGTTPGTFRAADYTGELRDLPIGVFDSGIGGLTVLEAIKRYDAHNNRTGADGADGVPDFAGERFIYLGDQANMPYGNYPASGRLDFLRELVLRDALFLLGHGYSELTPEGPVARRDKPAVKAIVIACNTATAVGLEDIRSALRQWGVPIFVVGVVEAGAVAAVENGRAGSIAIFSTVATCTAEAYPKAIRKATAAEHKAERAVLARGFPTLAAAIEGDASVRQTPAQIVREEVRAFVAQCEKEKPSAPIDTLVLGCTHYPLVQSDITQALAEEARAHPGLVAPVVAIVDPAERTALDLYRAMKERHLWASKPAMPADRYFITVANPRAAGVRLAADGGLATDYKYGRAPGNPGREDTVAVPLREETLPKSGAALVREHLPLVWAGIKSR